MRINLFQVPFSEVNFYSNYKVMSEVQGKPIDPPRSFFELGEVIKIIAPSNSDINNKIYLRN